MSLYFAYGSNMDPVRMGEHCPTARALGAARLPDHRVEFVWDSPGWGGGVATVVRADGDEVWGVLWEITPSDEEALDDYEGVVAGAYRKDRLTIMHAEQPADAMLYIATDDRHKPPSRRYMQCLLRGAQAFALPPHYVERLQAV